MEFQSEQVKTHAGHPGPYCIECKKPFGVEHPFGYMSNSGEPVYIQETVGTSEKTYCLCLDCMRKKRQKLHQQFLAILSEEQKKIFQELSALESSISSYVILMS